MNRGFTNAIRFIMDEFVPPLIRDSRWFMYPFYYFAYRGKSIREVMQFKSKVYKYSQEEYATFYQSLNTISRNRKTDLNKACIDYILEHIDSNSKTIIDVGCGGGYMLKTIAKKFPNMNLTGFDIKEPNESVPFNFVPGNVESLPFKDGEFDTVICSHTIEHLIQLENCISELIRITGKQLFVVTPCQRFYYYTLDEHVNFFPYSEKLTTLFPFQKYVCEKLQGDWMYHAQK